MPRLLAAAAASLLFACDRQTDSVSPAAADLSPSAAVGFVTSQPSLVRALLPQARLKPIITVGDPIPGQESNPDPEQRVWPALAARSAPSCISMWPTAPPGS